MFPEFKIFWRIMQAYEAILVRMFMILTKQTSDEMDIKGTVDQAMRKQK